VPLLEPGEGRRDHPIGPRRLQPRAEDAVEGVVEHAGDDRGDALGFVHVGQRGAPEVGQEADAGADL
jgi:hypothetical protein